MLNNNFTRRFRVMEKIENENQELCIEVLSNITRFNYNKNEILLVNVLVNVIFF